MVIFYKKWKNNNEIQLTKNKQNRLKQLNDKQESKNSNGIVV